MAAALVSAIAHAVEHGHFRHWARPRARRIEAVHAIASANQPDHRGHASGLWLHCWRACNCNNTSRGVHEEIGGSNLVAIQVLSQVEATSREGGLPAMLAFLQALGRIRGNEIELYGEDGTLLYRSPPPRYKAGRDAPQWYARLVAPPLKTRDIVLPHGRVVVRRPLAGDSGWLG
jgi:hypothetical protein